MNSLIVLVVKIVIFQFSAFELVFGVDCGRNEGDESMSTRFIQKVHIFQGSISSDIPSNDGCAEFNRNTMEYKCKLVRLFHIWRSSHNYLLFRNVNGQQDVHHQIAMLTKCSLKV